MKSFARLSLMGSGLGLILLTAAVPSFATVVGELQTGGNGTVTVTPTGITFTENDTFTGGGLSSTEVGAGTTLTFGPGLTLTQGQPIDINGGLTITPASLLAGIPITFPDTPGLTMTLTGFGPGSANACGGAMGPGDSCSPSTPFGASPIILTEVGTTDTTASLYVTGFATDGTTVTPLTGHFSSTIAGETPDQLAALGSFTAKTYSGDFLVTATPEPGTLSMLMLGGLLMGIVVAKRRRSMI